MRMYPCVCWCLWAKWAHTNLALPPPTSSTTPPHTHILHASHVPILTFHAPPIANVRSGRRGGGCEDPLAVGTGSDSRALGESWDPATELPAEENRGTRRVRRVNSEAVISVGLGFVIVNAGGGVEGFGVGEPPALLPPWPWIIPPPPPKSCGVAGAGCGGAGVDI